MRGSLLARGASFALFPFEPLLAVFSLRGCNAHQRFYSHRPYALGVIPYHLSQNFVTLLKERQADILHEWLKCAKASRVARLARFANGISRDYAAVYTACSRPESNGLRKDM